MSIVTKSIVNADAEARYLSPGELDRIKSFVLSGQRRLRIAQTLTDNRERIVKQGGQQLFQKRPDVVDLTPPEEADQLLVPKEKASGGKVKKMGMGGKCRGMGAAARGGAFTRNG